MFAVLLVSGSLAQGSACCQVALQSAPECGKIGSPRLDAKELAELEGQIRSLYAKLAPSVVRFFNPKRASSGFSGVIVSPSGEVLTCAHHNLPPNTKVVAELADGRRVQATILGSVKQEPSSRSRYAAADIGMARLDAKGPWPAVAHCSPSDVKAGARCLALGYPNAYLSGQPPLLRLGRVLAHDPFGRIRTSCRGQPGDSGGPLFDLDGRLIGVLNAMESLKTGVTLDSSVEAFIALRDRLRAGEAGVFERDLPDLFEWRKEESGWAIRPRKGSQKPQVAEPQSDRWGWEPDGAHKTILTKVRSIVEILSDNRIVAFGLVVDKDGWVLTKRTVLTGPTGPQRITCRLGDGKQFDARVVGESGAHDLALLKIPAAGLAAVLWGDADDLKVGRLIASLGPGPECLHYAVVAAVGCKNPGIKGELPIRVEPAPAGTKSVQCSGFPKERLDIDEVRGSLRPGDRITHVDDIATATVAEFATACDRRMQGPDSLAGEWVKLTVERERKVEYVFVPLVAGPAPLPIPWRDARWNLRRNGFPVVFCHDGGIASDRCGGPVVDRSGNVLGVNIARADPMQTFAIPSDVVQKVIATMKARAQRRAIR